MCFCGAIVWFCVHDQCCVCVVGVVEVRSHARIMATP